MATKSQDILVVRDAVSPEEWQLRVDLAGCYRMVAYYGWDDLIFTHLSARVPGPDKHFLIIRKKKHSGFGFRRGRKAYWRDL